MSETFIPPIPLLQIPRITFPPLQTPPRCTLTTPNPPKRPRPPFPEPVSASTNLPHWSEDYKDLCRAQFTLLQSTLHIKHCALFFRRENKTTGALEFIPLITFPAEGEEMSIWISSVDDDKNSGGRSWVVRRKIEDGDCKVLPGGFPAGVLLPDYPFVWFRGEDDDDMGQVMGDGGLCVPVVYGRTVGGLLTLWRDGGSGWSGEDRRKAGQVARTIALAASLEGRWQGEMRENGERAEVINGIRKVVAAAVHQARSPITALIIFGKLLLKKLPPGDRKRDLAKSIIVSSERLDNILMVLEDSKSSHILKQVQEYNLPPGEHLDEDSVEGNWEGSESGFIEKGEENKSGEEKESGVGKNGKQLVWISDVVVPLLESSKVLAGAKKINFTWFVNEDTPPIVARESELTEAINNLIDNAIKYTPVGGSISVQIDSWEHLVEVIVMDTGPGIPPGERDLVARAGFRGKKTANIPGSGLGLALVQRFAFSMGGQLTIDSQSELESPDPEAFPGTSMSLSIPRARMQES